MPIKALSIELSVLTALGTGLLFAFPYIPSDDVSKAGISLHSILLAGFFLLVSRGLSLKRPTFKNARLIRSIGMIFEWGLMFSYVYGLSQAFKILI